MDKNIKLTMLYDIYGKLLTIKQQEIFNEYYIYNLSLREIAQNKKISYQAVRDSIKSSERMLENFEEKVKMFDTLKNINSVVNICNSNSTSDEKVEEIIQLLK
ncbi:MAG: hypothetical protein RSB67_04365 [Clostridia bacterium]